MARNDYFKIRTNGRGEQILRLLGLAGYTCDDPCSVDNAPYLTINVNTYKVYAAKNRNGSTATDADLSFHLLPKNASVRTRMIDITEIGDPLTLGGAEVSVHYGNTVDLGKVSKYSCATFAEIKALYEAMR